LWGGRERSSCQCALLIVTTPSPDRAVVALAGERAAADWEPPQGRSGPGLIPLPHPGLSRGVRCGRPGLAATCLVGRVPSAAHHRATIDAVKLKLDLHDVYNRGHEIERALHDIIDQAIAKRASVVEIIPGKGSGQLKKRVLRFLDQKQIKQLYHRVEKDSKNFGRVFVHFRWKP